MMYVLALLVVVALAVWAIGQSRHADDTQSRAIYRTTVDWKDGMRSYTYFEKRLAVRDARRYRRRGVTVSVRRETWAGERLVRSEEVDVDGTC